MAANICFSLFISSSLFHFHLYFFFPLLPLPARFSYALSLLHSVYYVLNTHFHFPIFSQILYVYISFSLLLLLLLLLLWDFHFNFSAHFTHSTVDSHEWRKTRSITISRISFKRFSTLYSTWLYVLLITFLIM